MSRTMVAFTFTLLALSACSSGEDSGDGASPTADANVVTMDTSMVPFPDAGAGVAADSRPDAGGADGMPDAGGVSDAQGDAPYTASFSLDWTIEDVGPPTNDVVVCEDAGTTTVAVAATNTATGGVHDFSFPCSSRTGVLPLPSGSYSLALRLLRA